MTIVSVAAGSGSQSDSASTATGNVSGRGNSRNGGYDNLNGGVVAATSGNRVGRTNVKDGVAGQVAGSQCFAIRTNTIGDFGVVGIEPLASAVFCWNGGQGSHARTAKRSVLSDRSSGNAVDGGHHFLTCTDTLGVAVIRGHIIRGCIVDRRRGEVVFCTDGFTAFSNVIPANLVAVLSCSGGQVDLACTTAGAICYSGQCGNAVDGGGCRGRAS